MRKQDIGPLAAAIEERCRKERKQERDALVAVLVAEYVDLLARERRDHNRMPDLEKEWYTRGGRDALLRVANRLGIADLHDQAADVVALSAHGARVLP